MTTPPDIGTAVPEGFTLPWNRTVTMADVWADKIAAKRKSWREQYVRKRARYTRHNARIRYAGYEGADA